MATDRSTSTPTPNATAATCAYSPIWPPRAVPTPAARPSCSERLITNSTLGPGTTISAKETSVNASRCVVGSTGAPSVFAAGDGQADADADHGQAAGAPDHFEAARGAGDPGPGRARGQGPASVRQHRDPDEDHAEQQHLQRHVARGAVDELRQHRGEVHDRLGVGRPAQEPAPTD